ncbi:hypothetical protein K239x_20160 [Planctomycetes bacterium K23_9]|uniref:GIY-YIG domain-containing protein n=2 Tax=Stieleria marina TaxID=1930275 RepID=A0A517NSE8_9BACT|nr:hypothetical protein K239x_20160 [Planctomycetes bacterium K23_9]
MFAGQIDLEVHRNVKGESVQTYKQYIYGLIDPLQPEAVRYVGRTNDIEMRLRTHISEAQSNFTIKDVWLSFVSFSTSMSNTVRS